MVTEFLLYELGTTLGGLVGLKLLRLSDLNTRMSSIKQTKKLSIVNGLLKKQIGPLSKKEEWFSVKAVKAIQVISKYQEFRLMLVLIFRRFNAVRIKARRVHYVRRHRRKWSALASDSQTQAIKLC